MRPASRSMVSKTIICSSVRPWALIWPGIKKGQRGKIHCRRPHPLERGFEGHLQGIAIKRVQPPDGSGFPLYQLGGSLAATEELGLRPAGVGREETGKGVDKILRRHLAPMVEPDPLAEGERPEATISGRFPILGDRR